MQGLAGFAGIWKRAEQQPEGDEELHVHCLMRHSMTMWRSHSLRPRERNCSEAAYQSIKGLRTGPRLNEYIARQVTPNHIVEE